MTCSRITEPHNYASGKRINGYIESINMNLTQTNDRNKLMHHLNTPAQIILPTPCSADHELYTCASTQQTEFNNNPKPFQQKMIHILSSVLSAQQHTRNKTFSSASLRENKFTVYTEIYKNSIYAMPLNLKTQINYLLLQKQHDYNQSNEKTISGEIQCNTTTVLVLNRNYLVNTHMITELLKFHDTYLPIKKERKKKKKISPSIL